MGKFSMNDLLNGQSKGAATPQREKEPFPIRQIPLAKIRPSQRNRYGIREVEELADNIELVGLLHNLVVEEAEDGFYDLVSGERRYCALQLLVERGNAEYENAPCKVESESGEENPVISELKLLSANAYARDLSDYEKTYQAGRIKELLQVLKKDGHKIKGRRREIVAQMLKVSPAQMGRMESIYGHLSPEFTEEFKAEHIGITQAYELSTLTAQEQAAALGEYRETGNVDVEAIKAARTPAPPASPSLPEAPPREPEEQKVPEPEEPPAPEPEEQQSPPVTSPAPRAAEEKSAPEPQKPSGQQETAPPQAAAPTQTEPPCEKTQTEEEKCGDTAIIEALRGYGIELLRTDGTPRPASEIGADALKAAGLPTR